METPVPEPARASTATPLPVPSIAVSEPVAPSDPPAGHLRDDAALADAFARDFEADLGDVTDPDAVAEKAEAHAVGRTVTDVEAAEPGSDASDDAPRIGSLSEMDDLLSPSTPPGAIPPRSAPEPTPAPLSQAEDAVPAGPDPITPPRTRGQVPLDDEPTPRFPRFLREGGREAPRPPEPREAEVVVTEGARPVAGEDDPAPEAPGTRPFEALYRARDGAAARPSPILPSRGPEPAAAPSEEVPETTPADAPEMQSLEAQMESLLRELTERGKPGGHGPDEGNN